MNKSYIVTRAEQGLLSELIVTIPFALISAHLFVGFRQKENFLELILKRGYPLAFTFTFIVALGMMIYVKYVTRWLNRKHPVEKGRHMKLWLHIIYTGIALQFAEFLASTGYFFFFGGHHISRTVYFNSYLLLIILFILLINLYYNSKIAIPVPGDIEVEEQQGEISQNKKAVYAEIVEYAKGRDVAYISITERIIYARSSSGEAMYWNHNITDSSVALAGYNFFQISRGHIIRKDIIQNVEQAPLKRKLIIILKEGFDKGEKRIEVPVSKIKSFKKWMNQQ